MRGLIVVVASLIATNALADSHLYVGAGMGLTKFKQDGNELTSEADIKFDEEETGISLFAGFEITPKIAIEAGYIDFGDVRDTGGRLIAPPAGSGFSPVLIEDSARLEYEFDGYYINGQYRIPLGDRASVDLIGGLIFADSRATISLVQGDEWIRDESASTSDEGALVGAAFTLKATDAINVRGSLTYYQIDFDNTLDEPIRLGVDVIWDF